MYEVLARRLVRHIFSLILTIGKYTPDKIDEFCQAFIDYAAVATNPLYHTMATNLQAVLTPYHNAIEKTDIEKGERRTDVKVVLGLKEYIFESLTALLTNVNVISHNDKNIEIEFNLNKISSFYEGSEHDILKKFSELKTNITLKPAYVTLIPDITAIVAEVDSKYKAKKDIKISITKDTTDKKALLIPIAEVLLANFYDAGKLNIKTMDNMGNFFKTNILDGIDRSEGFLFKNEYIIKVLAGMKLCDPRIKFDFDSKFKVESTGFGDAMVFLSTTANPTSIPDNAQLIKAGESITFPVANIGSKTQLFLIFAAVTTGLDVNLMLTVK